MDYIDKKKETTRKHLVEINELALKIGELVYIVSDKSFDIPVGKDNWRDECRYYIYSPVRYVIDLIFELFESKDKTSNRAYKINRCSFELTDSGYAPFISNEEKVALIKKKVEEYFTIDYIIHGVESIWHYNECLNKSIDAFVAKFAKEAGYYQDLKEILRIAKFDGNASNIAGFKIGFSKYTSGNVTEYNNIYHEIKKAKEKVNNQIVEFSKMLNNDALVKSSIRNEKNS